jgi:hypothetical protein
MYHNRTEGCDFLSVLDELNPDAFPNGGIGLFGLDTDLFEDDSLGVRRSTEWRGLERGSEETLLVVQVGPTAFSTMVAQLARGVEASRLAFTHTCWQLSVNRSSATV